MYSPQNPIKCSVFVILLATFLTFSMGVVIEPTQAAKSEELTRLSLVQSAKAS